MILLVRVNGLFSLLSNIVWARVIQEIYCAFDLGLALPRLNFLSGLSLIVWREKSLGLHQLLAPLVCELISLESYTFPNLCGDVITVIIHTLALWTHVHQLDVELDILLIELLLQVSDPVDDRLLLSDRLYSLTFLHGQ